MTTAEFRKSAQEAERLLLWHSAACLWDKAIEAYPQHAPNSLAALDIAKMRARADACRHAPA